MPQYQGVTGVHKPYDQLSSDAGMVVLIRVPPPETVFQARPLVEWAVLDKAVILRKGRPDLELVIADAVHEGAQYILGRATMSGNVSPLTDAEMAAVQGLAAWAVNQFWS